MTKVERTTVREEVERIEETETFRQCDGCRVDDSEAELRTLHANPHATSAITNRDLGRIVLELERRPSPSASIPPSAPGVSISRASSHREMYRDRIAEELRDSVELTSDGEIDLCPECAYTFFDYEYDGRGDTPDIDDENLRIEWADSEGLDVQTTVEKQALIQVGASTPAAFGLVGVGFVVGAALATEVAIPMAGLWALVILLLVGGWGPHVYRAISRRGEE